MAGEAERDFVGEAERDGGGGVVSVVEPEDALDWESDTWAERMIDATLSSAFISPLYVSSAHLLPPYTAYTYTYLLSIPQPILTKPPKRLAFTKRPPIPPRPRPLIQRPKNT